MAAVSDDVERRQHQLRATLPPYPVTVFADAPRLTQVISNLLGNAVKYTPHGGVITVNVDAPESGTVPEHDSTPPELVVTFRDNGVGIAPDELPRVFDLYAQSPSARTVAEGGLGLGLSVVKYLDDAHQGQVSITNDGEGKGTEVVLRLPIVHRSDIEHAAPTTHGIQPARILLVDDNADATEALAMLLSLDGHEVERARNGPEALSIVDSFTPDLALTDINMPEMDGHELVRRLRQLAQARQHASWP
ncbi:putative Histidine kinase [Paraburkholderia caribensis]|nr:putative Histidine kinase [Paraburkholderia caribensis]